LQHSHNPVDWYPWGSEAFERARREKKPIFLSIGYSTCYWCHVMERESFESAAVAAVMNEHFVCIKLDREERPDVDQLYMTAVQVQTHHGGWPMNVFLTPQLEYFYGGTYFPPTDLPGRTGFVSVLRAIHDAWENRNAEVARAAAQFTRILQQVEVASNTQTAHSLQPNAIAQMVMRSASDFDAQNGGFGRAPKFPRQTLLQLILAATIPESPVARELGEQAGILEQRVRATLDAMMYGGIRDQLGGAFHRYSTDAQWLVPHFEIMLYDNALLASVYLTAASRFREPRYEVVARELLDFVLAKMRTREGAFSTAIDAEVCAREGLSYLWTQQEVRQVLGSKEEGSNCSAFAHREIDTFCEVFGLTTGPNFADPHYANGQPDANILYVADVEKFHAQFDVLKRMRERLHSARDRREQPMVDLKVITSWNALMIRVLAEAGSTLSEARYLHAAEAAARFILDNHLTSEGQLRRTSRDGISKHAGVLEDYACLAEALLVLARLTGNPNWKGSAQRLVDEMLRRLHDDDGGFFFTDRNADDLIVRQKSGTDNPLPSGNAVAAQVLLKLGKRDDAQRVVAAFDSKLHSQAEAMSAMLAVSIELCGSSQFLPTQGAAAHAPPIDEGQIVSVTCTRRSATLLALTVRIAPGWHIATQVAQPGVAPTVVTLSHDPTATVRFPPPTETGAFGNSYSGEIQVEIETTIAEGELILNYQSCNATRCRGVERAFAPVPEQR